MTPPEEWLWDWDSLTTLSSDSDRTRSFLFRVLTGDAEGRQGLVNALQCQVANQGQLYTAAAACVDIIARHVESGNVLNSDSVSLLEVILNARTPGLQVVVNGIRVDLAEYCRQRILDVLPKILRSADGEDFSYFREVCFLIPQLADSSPQVIEFLRRASSLHQGESRRVIDDSLEESEEVVRDGHMP